MLAKPPLPHGEALKNGLLMMGEDNTDCGIVLCVDAERIRKRGDVVIMPNHAINKESADIVYVAHRMDSPIFNGKVIRLSATASGSVMVPHNYSARIDADILNQSTESGVFRIKGKANIGSELVMEVGDVNVMTGGIDIMNIKREGEIMESEAKRMLC